MATGVLDEFLGFSRFRPDAGLPDFLALDAMPACFDEFVLDLDKRELSRAGESIHIPPKAFRLLETLLKSAPNAGLRAGGLQCTRYDAPDVRDQRGDPADVFSR